MKLPARVLLGFSGGRLLGISEPHLRHFTPALLGFSTALLLAACGGPGGSGPAISATRIPLIAGVRVVASARQCDRGANPFCARELVVSSARFTSSGAMVTAEHDLLRARRWMDASGDFGQEQAADSSGHKLHLTYATALAELTGIDEGWIKRPRPLALVLSRQLFAGIPTMTLTLTSGPA